MLPPVPKEGGLAKRELNLFGDPKAAAAATFVLPQFLYAGNFSYVIEFEGEFYFHKCLVNYRTESIPSKVLDVGEYEEEQHESKPFSHPGSVFRLYQVQAPEALAEACYEHDKRCLELSSFLDHANEYDADQFMEKRMLELKYAYTFVLGESQSPRGVDENSLVSFIVDTCATRSLKDR